jgi:hypothetical protein
MRRVRYRRFLRRHNHGLALRQHGVDVRLFEQAAALRQVGAGLQLSSNAARILLKLGLGDALKRVATYPEGRDYRGWAHLDLGSVVGVWMGPNRSIVQYYVSAGKTFNWIGISRSAEPARESWLAEGQIDHALTEYEGWHSTIRRISRRLPRSCAKRFTTANRCPIGKSGVSYLWATPRIR